MATVPTFAATPRHSAVSISTANTGRDGSGTISTVFLAGNNGSRIDWIRAWAVTPVTNGVIRYYISGNNTNYLFSETPIPPTTPTTSGSNWSNDFLPPVALVLQSGENFRASTQNAEQFFIQAFGGDF